MFDNSDHEGSTRDSLILNNCFINEKHSGFEKIA